MPRARGCCAAPGGGLALTADGDAQTGDVARAVEGEPGAEPSQLESDRGFRGTVVSQRGQAFGIENDLTGVEQSRAAASSQRPSGPSPASSAFEDAADGAEAIAAANRLCFAVDAGLEVSPLEARRTRDRLPVGRRRDPAVANALARNALVGQRPTAPARSASPSRSPSSRGLRPSPRAGPVSSKRRGAQAGEQHGACPERTTSAQRKGAPGASTFGATCARRGSAHRNRCCGRGGSRPSRSRNSPLAASRHRPPDACPLRRQTPIAGPARL
jgi:hypothetical protein